MKITRLVGLVCCLGLAPIIATPLWAGGVTYDYDDFGRLIDVLYDDGTRIIYTYDDAGNRLTQVITIPAPQADLRVTIVDSADPVTQGDNVTYTATVTNNGPDPATGVNLAATLPADTTLVLATPSQGTCDTVVSCALGTNASLGTATVTIEVSADAAGSIGYLMSVSASEADPDATNNSQTETTTVNAPPSGDVIVDNLDPNTSQTGTRKVSTDANFFAGQSLFADKAATFRWLPTLPQQGTYAVYAWWVFHNKNSSAVPLKISHAGGTDIVNVNQHNSALEGQWNLLGSFNAGSGAWVEVSRPGG